MPNAFAYLVLFSWPVVMLMLFLFQPLHKALIWSLLGAYLLLPPPPTGLDVPLLRSLDKETLTVIVLTGLAVWRYGPKALSLPYRNTGRLLMLVFVISPVFTAITNTEALFFDNGTVVPSLRWNDALGLCVAQIMTLLPFILAYNALNERESLRTLLVALVIAGVIYSFPMLIEIRLSPQLNNWIYGYHQHLFSQTIRASGYRPLVFLEHGLWLAFFIMTAGLSALALWRATPPPGRALFMVAFLYLTLILVLSKSLGALVFAIVLTPVILLVGRNTQLFLAMVVALFALSYPVMKTAGVFPEDRLVAQANKVSADRAHSLKFRFDNERVLLDRANEKPLFGWGSWGRNHIRDSFTGKITSVTDGRWIVVVGALGWIGFLAEFGLLTLPLLRLHSAARREPVDQTSRTIGALALILAFNILDLLPNATMTPLTWVIAGALMGYADRAVRDFEPLVRKRRALLWKPIL